jgi:TatD DNase family protein
MNGKIKSLNLVYTLGNKIYINLTNKCSNRCVFCIRNVSEEVEGKNLWLSSEDFGADDVIAQLQDVIAQNLGVKEIVFCGFGEPLIKFDLFCVVSKYIKDNYKDFKIRVNTNGQANLIHKKDIIPEFSKYADVVSVSLNGENQEVYNKVSQPIDKEHSYEEVKKFIDECVKSGIETYATVVTGCNDAIIDVAKCEKITTSLGAKFRVREWLPKGY